MKQETASVIADSVRAAPPVSVVAVTIAGMTLQDWVYAATLVYTALLITQHIWTKWVLPLWSDEQQDDP